MTVVPFDTLAMAGKLEAGGFSHDQARVIASAPADALGERMATADDIRLLHHDFDAFRTEMRQDMETSRVAIHRDMNAFRVEIRGDMDAFKGEMRQELETFRVEIHRDMDAFKGEMRQEMEAFKGEVRQDIANLRGEMEARFCQVNARFKEIDGRFRELEQRLTIRLGGMIVVATGILLAANFFA